MNSNRQCMKRERSEDTPIADDGSESSYSDSRSRSHRSKQSARKARKRARRRITISRSSSPYQLSDEGTSRPRDSSASKSMPIKPEHHASNQTDVETISADSNSGNIQNVFVILHQKLKSSNEGDGVDTSYSVETISAFSTLDAANRAAWIVALERHGEFALPGRIRTRTEDNQNDSGKCLEWAQDEDDTLELWCCSSGTTVDYKIWVSMVTLDSG